MTMIVAALIAFVQPAPAFDVERLGWMIGDWTCRQHERTPRAPVSSDEHWVRDRTGGLFGVGRAWRETTEELEHMRIAPDPSGRVRFVASRNGAPPVAFALVRAAPGELVFENSAHDYPQRIRYARHGVDDLVATISLIDGSRARSWHYVRTYRVRPRGSSERPLCSDAASPMESRVRPSRPPSPPAR